MKLLYSGGLCAVALTVLNMAAFAQATQSSPQSNDAKSQKASTDQQVTVTGCIQREADYRRATDAGRGGVAGTGVGAGNEFVLINASTSTTAAAGAAGAAGAGAAAATGTTGSSGTAYELTGTNEGQAAQHVGQRVEIMGKLKPAEVSASGRATGGPTAGKPPEGIDVAGKDLKLRELEVSSIRSVPGSCQAQ